MTIEVTRAREIFNFLARAPSIRKLRAGDGECWRGADHSAERLAGMRPCCWLAQEGSIVAAGT